MKKSDDLFFIVRGQVEVHDDPIGNILAKLESGNFFGELALLSRKGIRSANVLAVGFAILAKLSKSRFDAVVQHTSSKAEA